MNLRRHIRQRQTSTRSRSLRWNIVAVFLAALTAALAAFLPLGTSVSESVSSDGTIVTTTSHPSLLSNEGPRVLIVLLIPVLVVALPLLFGRHKRAQSARVGVTVILGLLVLLGAASIGMFFLPTLAAMGASLATAAKPAAPAATS